MLTVPGISAADAATEPPAATSALCGIGPLEILLTNDDGFDAAGIRALRAQLVEAGHRVMLVAPDPGTVGAALAGTVLVDPPIPGVAVNAARAVAAEPIDSVVNRAHLDAVARDATNLIAAHRNWFCDRGRVVRPRAVLNVNYPALPVSQLNGSRMTWQGSASDLRIVFEQTAAGKYTARTRQAEAIGDRDSDNYWLAAGYVTITPLGAALTYDEGRDAPSQR